MHNSSKQTLFVVLKFFSLTIIKQQNKQTKKKKTATTTLSEQLKYNNKCPQKMLIP
ncbi:hypothetical protein DOY81_002142 [Sarcophaga bullata]|nr:hypothetical protein DOY81_002142 [Sarcophaga bullata]